MEALEATAPLLREAAVGPAVEVGLATDAAVPAACRRQAMGVAAADGVAPAPALGGLRSGRVRDGPTPTVAGAAPGVRPGPAVPFVLPGQAAGAPVTATSEGPLGRGGRAAP